MTINFENLEDSIYQEIKEEMQTCGRFDSVTCSSFTKDSIRMANASSELLQALKDLMENAGMSNRTVKGVMVSEPLCYCDDYDNEGDCPFCKALSAISKAEGKQL